jgi:L-arabinonolactonase
MLEMIVDARNQLGECVMWDDRAQRVLWTDIIGATLWAHDPATGQTQSWPMPERLSNFALTDNPDRLLIGLASQLAFFDFSTGQVTPIAKVEEGLSTRLNDGRCDREGRFVFGTFNEADPKPAIGSFYRLNRDLSLEVLPLKKVAIANSICFSPDGKTMYYADSPDKAIRCCDYPSFANDRVFAVTEGEGEPDGSCIDADGYLWNAQWGSKQVVRYAPDGRIERRIDTPAMQPSCVALGGANFDVVYASSARVGLAEVSVQDGGLLAKQVAGVRGLPETRFKL